MDALQIQFKPSLWGRVYLITIYLVTLTFVLRIAAPHVFWFIAPLLIAFYLEWQRHFAKSTRRCLGLACDPSGAGQRLSRAWRIKLADEWYAVGELNIYYQLPWLLAIKINDYPQGRPRVLIVWRDMVDPLQWKLLRVYLAL